MGGWTAKNEEAICLTCHKVIDFQWREAPDGSSLEAVSPTRAVAREPDEKKREVTWVTLQQRCRCGTTIGCLVELTASAAAPPPPA